MDINRDCLMVHWLSIKAEGSEWAFVLVLGKQHKEADESGTEAPDCITLPCDMHLTDCCLCCS
jgi:hypothetical protein